MIVVESDEPKAMKAGQALQTYIEKMSGTRLSLVQEGEAVEGDPVRLPIGHTQAARELGVEIPAGYDRTMRPEIFEEEGYADNCESDPYGVSSPQNILANIDEKEPVAA